jgi:signal transduction histidine kinase
VNAPRVDVRVSGDVEGLAPGIDAAIFRIAQESVTNALRHSRAASRIEVSVVSGDDVVRLDVTDDGEQSLAPTTDVGFGLVGMAERVALLDGTFEAGPRPDGGWAVSAVLPRNAVSA